MSNVPPEILSAVDSYERGRITLDEAMLKIFGAIRNTSDALATLKHISLEWKLRIWENVDAAPTHDHQWNSTRVLCIGTYIGDDAADRFAQQNRDALVRYRLGVECLRALNRTT